MMPILLIIKNYKNYQYNREYNEKNELDSM